MYITDAIITYVVVLAIVFFIMTYILGYNWWSALIMSLLLATLSLLAVFPIWDLKNEPLSPSLIIYLFVIIVTPVIAVFYILTKALVDFNDCNTIYRFVV